MHTQSDALAYITEAIEATGVVKDAAAEYDLDGLADKLYAAAGGWDLTDLDTGIFWWVVQRHTRDAEAASTAPAEIPAGTDELIRALTEAGQSVAQARKNLRAAESVRDELLIRAAHTETLNQSRLAELAGITRARAHQIINR